MAGDLERETRLSLRMQKTFTFHPFLECHSDTPRNLPVPRGRVTICEEVSIPTG